MGGAGPSTSAAPSTTRPAPGLAPLPALRQVCARARRRRALPAASHPSRPCGRHAHAHAHALAASGLPLRPRALPGPAAGPRTRTKPQIPGPPAPAALLDLNPGAGAGAAELGNLQLIDAEFQHPRWAELFFHLALNASVLGQRKAIAGTSGPRGPSRVDSGPSCQAPPVPRKRPVTILGSPQEQNADADRGKVRTEGHLASWRHGFALLLSLCANKRIQVCCV